MLQQVSLNHDTQMCMDPNVIECKVVVSSTGHDGPMGASGVKRLARLGMIDAIPGMAALDMNTAEDVIVRDTREVVPGMVICGMEVLLDRSVQIWRLLAEFVLTILSVGR